MGRVEGKIAVITGGNSGVGAAAARLFAKEGATVVITARREVALNEVADEIKAAGLDVSSPENQYLVTVNVTLVYGTEVIKDNIMYNPSTGWSNSKPIIVDTSSGKHMLIPNVIWSGNNNSGSGSGSGLGVGSGSGSGSYSCSN